MKFALFSLVALLQIPIFAGAQAGDPVGLFQMVNEKVDTSVIESLPMQDRGRLKPFQTFAREANLFLTGKYKFFDVNPMAFYLTLIVHPDLKALEIINVRDVALRTELGFDKSKRYFSMGELEKTDLENMVGPLLKKERENPRSLEPHEKSVIEVYNQLYFLQNINSGNHWLGALDLSHLTSGDQSQNAHAESKTLAAAKVYLQTLANGDSTKSEVTAAGQLLLENARVQPVPEAFQRQLPNMQLEVFYNNSHIFFIAALLFFAFGGAFLTKRGREILSRKYIYMLSVLPLILLFLGFAIRVKLTGFAPVTNMYGTMIWVSFGVCLFSLVAFALYRNFAVLGSLWILSGGVLLLTESLPLVLSPDLDPIVAVLRSNLWLTIHVLTIVISYSAFSITMILGNIVLVRSIFKSEYSSPFINEFARTIYRMSQLGVFLISVGIVLGGVWADYSWGRFWGWDPKETWALIADVGYLAILHARYAGWLTPFGLALVSPIAYLLVIMAWYGVNFILAAGLHSYGFSKGGAAMVSTFVIIQLILVLTAYGLWFVRRRKTLASN